MHPALSVIVFTTLSGIGFGLLAWLGVHYAWRPLPLSPEFAQVPFILALGLVSLGLLSSLLHLGRPARAWRALSQWRSSWLSREAVLALLCYPLALGLILALRAGAVGPLTQALGALSAACALATIGATAMIYASLPTIPAWRDRRVLPVYLLYGLLGGAFLLAALLGLAGWRLPDAARIALAAGLLALAWHKLGYWRALDASNAAERAQGRASALGLAAGRVARPSAAGHTEPNFICREMGFVLARRHARRLRGIALALSVGLPLLALLAAPRHLPGAALGAALALCSGALVERWLFFAEARHLVMRYYGDAL